MRQEQQVNFVYLWPKWQSWWWWGCWYCYKVA